MDSLQGLEAQPISNVLWVHVDCVRANDYNPNSVAGPEMRLLYTSIKADGYTQPVVTVKGELDGTYVIVDGFHRYTIMRTYKDIFDRTDGLLPIVVIDKPLADRMASTIRHNRARGKHSIGGMTTIVYGMLTEGISDETICNELGMEPEELVRLKHVSGFSKLFKDVEYKKAWETEKQINYRKNWVES